MLKQFYRIRDKTLPYYFIAFAVGNLAGPLLLGQLFDSAGRRKIIGGGKNTTTLFIGYLLSAVIMVIGGIVAALLGVAAQGKSLEAVATALATANRTGPTTKEPIRGG